MSFKPFHVDASVLAVTNADGNRKKLWLQSLLLLWNNSEVTSRYPITSLDTARQIIESGPHEYIESRLEKKKGETVQLPPEFDDIRRYAQELRGASLNDFQLKDGTADFSPRFYAKQINRVYYFAVTPDQIKRLKYAQGLAKELEKQKDFFDDECQAAGISNKNFRYSPVPAGTRLDYVQGSHRPVVDPVWVVRGFASTVPALVDAARTSGEAFGNFRIAHTANDMILLDSDSAPKGYTVLSGHYEFIGNVCRPKQSKFERVLNAIS